jgi:hypothetical protein
MFIEPNRFIVCKLNTDKACRKKHVNLDFENVIFL